VYGHPTNDGLDFIEGDRDFVVFEYMYSEKLTLKEGLEICPECMI